MGIKLTYKRNFVAQLKNEPVVRREFVVLGINRTRV